MLADRVRLDAAARAKASEARNDNAAAQLRRVAQAKLRVGAADDPYEHEADEIARLVVERAQSNTPIEAESSRIRRGDAVHGSPAEQAGASDGSRIRRRTAALVGREGGPLDTDTEQLLDSARQGGTAIAEPLQRQIGDVVGADVSGVRLHSGEVSRELNDRLSAEAFTVGRDVFFRDGVPDTSSAAGLGLVAHEVAHTVQQGATPVSRRLSGERDETETAEAETETEEAPEATEAEEETEEAAEETEETEAETGADVEMSGTIPDVKETTDPEDVAGLGNREEDSAGNMVVAARRRHAPTSSTTAIPVELGGNVAATSTVRQGTGRVGDADSLRGGNITATGQVTGPVATTDAFGAMATNISFSGVSWKMAKGKINVDLTINGVYEWEVYGGGCTDVSTPDAAIITADNYEEISEDLTPKLEGKCWRPPRDKYWSQALTERHEKYHANDADGWVKKKGPGVVKSYLKKNPIELDDDERKDKTVVEQKVKAVTDEALDEVIEGRRFYFRKNITDYLKYPGEIRAFGDGKAPYAKLAKGIKDHGKKLAKAKAAKDKAATSTKAAASTDGDTT